MLCIATFSKEPYDQIESAQKNSRSSAWSYLEKPYDQVGSDQPKKGDHSS